MINWFVLLMRARRYVKACIHDTFSQTMAPLTDASARLNYIGVLIVLLLLSPRGGPDKQLSFLTTALEGLETALYAVPAFLLVNLVCALFRVRANERNLGKWFGTRFIYHEPVRLATVLVDEQDNGKHLRFAIDGPEDSSLVSYIIETDRRDNRAKVELAWPNGKRPMECGTPMQHPRGSFRLPKSRDMALMTHVEPQSTVTTVRVFMTGWEVGKGDGRG